MNNLIEDLDEEQLQELENAREAVAERIKEGDFSYTDIEEIMLEHGFEMDYILEVLPI